MAGSAGGTGRECSQLLHDGLELGDVIGWVDGMVVGSGLFNCRWKRSTKPLDMGW